MLLMSEEAIGALQVPVGAHILWPLATTQSAPSACTGTAADTGERTLEGGVACF